MISERQHFLEGDRQVAARTRSSTTAQPASAPTPGAPPSRGSGASGTFTSLLEQATHEILAVTFWFEPAPRAEPYPATIRFVGRRTGVDGPLQPGDRFTWDETIAQVVPGSGPISVTARVPNLHPGKWAVTAQVQGPGRPAHGTPRRRKHRSAMLVAASVTHDAHNTPQQYPLLPRLWRRWAPATGASLDTAEPVQTCLVPFVRVPGMLPLSWVSLVSLGMALALVLQALLLAREQLAVGRVLLATVGAVAVGIAGAKAWFIVKHHSEHRFEGWCIQGFIAGASLTALLLFTALDLPTGTVLEATAPGLLFGLAVGRIGCFFAGCCGGPPTAARWGVWASDQRVGARRIPTQLLESALALSLGLVALVVLLRHGSAGGALFVGGVAAYTLGRQGVLRLRAEPHQTQWAVPATALASTVALIIAVAVHVLA